MGQYQVIRKLATGGMAEVFLAKRVSAGGFEKAVAIKRLLPELARDPRSVADFLREAKLCSLLSHPNVVQVLDYGTAGGLPYLVMELVDGPDLRRVVNAAKRAGSPVSCDEALYVMAAVVDALGYAWEARGPGGAPLHVVHRDVNPMNVLVSLDGRIKLADFGVARADDRERTQAGLIKGKLGYIAPELARGAEPSHRGDLFLAGAVLWELLAGEPLFKARSNAVQAVSEMLAYDETQLPDPHCDAPEVLPVLRRALARDPEARYEHARDFAKDLRAVLAARGAAAGPDHLAARLQALFPGRRPLEDELRATGCTLREDGASGRALAAPVPASAPAPAASPGPSPAPGGPAPAPASAPAPAAAPSPAPAKPARHRRLGELLVERGVITANQLQTLLAHQRREGGRLGEWAIELDFAPARTVLSALATQLGVPFVTDEKLLTFEPPKELLQRYPQETALRLLSLPLALKDGWVYVATTDPADLARRDAVGFAVGRRCRPVLCTELGMRQAISRAYGQPEQQLRWRQIDPGSPHALLTSRVVDLEAGPARAGAGGSLAPQPASAAVATPATPWPVVYLPAGTGANGQPLFVAVPYGAIGGAAPALPAAAPGVPVSASEGRGARTRGAPVQPLPEIDPGAVQLVDAEEDA